MTVSLESRYIFLFSRTRLHFQIQISCEHKKSSIPFIAKIIIFLRRIQCRRTVKLNGFVKKKSLRGENSMWFSMEKKESVTTLRLSVYRSVAKTCWRNARLRHEKWYMKYEYIPSWKSTENSANICFARRGLDFMVFHYFVLEFVAKHRPYFLYNTFSLSTLKPWS